ncbi:regulator of microtubule dynamics protein 1-like isoform X2 [Euwallacea fornicatus]|uniref:regulator of microtubule dynamics protein 1-like isoform X2 n=1 Tax=Euwallacea fornicatus TaxID=995702 RepID=UPI00338F74ED
MPLQHLSAFLGAAVLGFIGAAGMFLVEHLRQEMRTSVAKDVAKLEKDLLKVKLELQQLQNQQSTERSVRQKKPSKAKKANSIISNTTDECFSVSNIDSSDMEFYDFSDDESSQVNSTSSLDLLLKELDKKIDSGNVEDIEESLQKLEDLCLEHPSNPELLYRIGKAHHKLAEGHDDKEVIHKKLNKGIDACRAALNLAPYHAEVHKWLAVLIGSRSNLLSLQERINDGHLFKKHVDIAISINPNDSSLHYMLGRFNFEIAGLKWYERKVATTLFGELHNASYKDALTNFLKAEQLAKFEWKENRLMIAKCKEALGQFKEVLNWLQKAKVGRNTTLDEKVDSDIESMLLKYRDYSR